nr:hypothetical protein BaRGS_030657 [Batillaria attramentaria]
MYEGVRVEEYSRKETKHVYRQVYYAVYKVTVQFTVPMWTFEVQTTSLPVLVRTGAVQAAEHVGVQLCLSYIAKNVLDPRVTVPTSMKIEDIVQMMNERIRGIGGRGLESYEKEFLREKLALMKSTKGSKGQNKEVTLEAFIKDKVVLPSQAAYGLASTDSKGDEMPFSLWRWLHSVINLLEKTIKQPWLDGVIYGFASRKHCEEILMDKPEGTFLLRFSESTVQGNHKESQGGLGLVGKVGGKCMLLYIQLLQSQWFL